MPVVPPQTFSLCLITDNKAGHHSQLQGFVHGLQQQVEVQERWVRTEDGFGACLSQLRALPKHTLVVGAGGATLRYLVIAKKLFKLPIVVLSRPRIWPLSWFDKVAVPKHDGLKEGGNILCTEGVLSAVKPAVSPDPKLGLILIGGPSKHHGWDGAALLEQIQVILNIDKEKHWRLTTSRRTPEGFVEQLAILNCPGLDIFPVTDTPPNWVRDGLAHSAVCWVTEDSMSMMFEGLSAGIQVGLLKMPRLRTGRVSRSIDDLVQRQLLTCFDYFKSHHQLMPARRPLQEAVRVGKVIAEMMALGHSDG